MATYQHLSLCAHCGELGAMVACAMCNKVWYCDTSCLNYDLANHYGSCAMMLYTRPTDLRVDKHELYHREYYHGSGPFCRGTKEYRHVDCLTEPLVIAVKRFWPNSLTESLKRGANALIRTDNGNTLLHILVKKFCMRTKKLSDGGRKIRHSFDQYLGTYVIAPCLRFAGVEFRDKTALPSLSVCSQIIAVLLSQRLSINDVNHAMKPPIYYAILGNNLGLVKLLYAHGADIHFPIYMPVTNAWPRTSTPACTFDPRKTTTTTTTLLVAAMQLQHDKVVKLIIKVLGPPKFALSMAYLYSWVSAPNRAVDGHSARTPLHDAINHGSISLAKALIAAGADFRRPDPDTGISPVISALNVDMESFLRRHGATNNDFIGCETYEICFLLRTHIIPVMFQRRICKSSVDNLCALSGASRLLAIDQKTRDIHLGLAKTADYLMSYAQRTRSDIRDHAELNKMIVYCTIGEYDLNPLYHPIYYGNESMVKMLILAGANVNTVLNDRKSNTPLTLAVRVNSEKVALILLESGANILLPCLGDGKTPVQIATEKNFRDMLVTIGPFLLRKLSSLK